MDKHQKNNNISQNLALIEALSTLMQQKKEVSFAGVDINKIIQAVIGALMIWSISQISMNSQDIIGLKSDVKNHDEHFSKVERFMDEPRYTERQGKTAIALAVNPIATKVTEFEMKLQSRGEWMSQTEKRVTANEMRYTQIQENLGQIKLMLEKRK